MFATEIRTNHAVLIWCVLQCSVCSILKLCGRSRGGPSHFTLATNRLVVIVFVISVQRDGIVEHVLSIDII